MRRCIVKIEVIETAVLMAAVFIISKEVTEVIVYFKSVNLKTKKGVSLQILEKARRDGAKYVQQT